MGGFLFGDVAWSPFAGHGGSWRDGAAAGGFPRAGRAVWGVLEWFRGGGGVSAVRAGLLARVMTAGAGRVPVSFGADCGEDEAAGAGQGQVAAADGLPGAAYLLRGSRGEGGVAGDDAGHLGGV